MDWLATPCADPAKQLAATRNRALVLLGFWRGFRSDDLTRLQVEHVQVFPGEGLVLYLPRSKTDRTNQGREYKVPALSQLRPVAACQDWLALSGLTDGPVFRGIDRWGRTLGCRAQSAKRRAAVTAATDRSWSRGCPVVHQPLVAARLCQLGRQQRLGCAGVDGVRRLEGHQVGDALYRAGRPVCPRPHRSHATTGHRCNVK